MIYAKINDEFYISINRILKPDLNENEIKDFFTGLCNFLNLEYKRAEFISEEEYDRETEGNNDEM